RRARARGGGERAAGRARRGARIARCTRCTARCTARCPSWANRGTAARNAAARRAAPACRGLAVGARQAESPPSRNETAYVRAVTIEEPLPFQPGRAMPSKLDEGELARSADLAGETQEVGV